MGVTLEIFHSSGTHVWDSDSLKIVVTAGAMASDVPRNMWLEMPSGFLAGEELVNFLLGTADT